MLQLIYKIGGDINPLKKSLAQAPTEAAKAGKEAGNAFGKELGAQAKGALMSFIGAGAIVGMFRQAMEQAKNITKEQGRTGLGSKEVQALGRASERTGLSQDELLARGKANPQAFSALMSSIEAEGGFLSDQNVGSLGRIGSAAEQAKNLAMRGIGGAFEAGTRGLEGLTYGAFAGAASGAGMLARITGSDRLKAVERDFLTRAEIGAESLAGVPGASAGTAQSRESKEVADAIRALRQTVDEKL